MVIPPARPFDSFSSICATVFFLGIWWWTSCTGILVTCCYSKTFALPCNPLQATFAATLCFFQLAGLWERGLRNPWLQSWCALPWLLSPLDSAIVACVGFLCPRGLGQWLAFLHTSSTPVAGVWIICLSCCLRCGAALRISLWVLMSMDTILYGDR